MRTEARKKANDKYNKNAYDTILLRIPKESKEPLQRLLLSELGASNVNKSLIELIEKGELVRN